MWGVCGKEKAEAVFCMKPFGGVNHYHLLFPINPYYSLLFPIIIVGLDDFDHLIIIRICMLDMVRVHI